MMGKSIAIDPKHDECSGGHSVHLKALRALDRVDDMPAELRECVHEFGYAIVDACRQAGVTKAANIRQLVHVIWAGARNPGQRMGRGISGATAHLDWLLIQSGSPIPARTLLRELAAKHHVLVPRHPSVAMIEASMDATNHMGVVSKRQKHLNRLNAAIEAHMKATWPEFYT